MFLLFFKKKSGYFESSSGFQIYKFKQTQYIKLHPPYSLLRFIYG